MWCALGGQSACGLSVGGQSACGLSVGARSVCMWYVCRR